MTVKLDMFLHKLAQSRSRLAILLLPAIFCILFLAFSARSVPIEDNEIAPVDKKHKEQPVWHLEEKEEEKDLTLNQDGARIPLNDDNDNQEEQPAGKGKLISTLDGETEKEQEGEEKKEKVDEQDEKVDRFETALDKEKEEDGEKNKGENDDLVEDKKDTPADEKKEDEKEDNGESVRDSAEPVDIKKGIPDEEKEKLTEDGEKKEEAVDKIERDGVVTKKREDGDTPTKEEILKEDEGKKTEEDGKKKETENGKETTENEKTLKEESDKKAEDVDKTPTEEKRILGEDKKTEDESNEETKTEDIKPKSGEKSGNEEKGMMRDSEVMASEMKGDQKEMVEICEDGDKEECKKKEKGENGDEKNKEPVLIPSVLDAPRPTDDEKPEAGENIEKPEDKTEKTDDEEETTPKEEKFEGITPAIQTNKESDGTEQKTDEENTEGKQEIGNVGEEINGASQDNSTVVAGEEVKPDDEAKPEEPTTLSSLLGVDQMAEEQLGKITKATTKSLLEEDLAEKKSAEKKKTSGRSRKSRKIVHSTDVEATQTDSTIPEPEKKLNLEDIIAKAKKAITETGKANPTEGEKPEGPFPEEHQLLPKDPL